MHCAYQPVPVPYQYRTSTEMNSVHRYGPVSGISRGRKKKREKMENLEIRHCAPDLDPLPAGFSALHGENLWRSRGEENDTRCAGFSSRLREEISSPFVSFSGRRHFFSPRGEKKRLSAWGEGTRRHYRYTDCPVPGGIVKIDRRRLIEREIDRRRSIEGEKWKKKKRKRRKMKKRRRRKKKTSFPRTVLARTPSPPAGRSCAVVARGRFFSRVRRKIEATDCDKEKR
ncbi:hypothetical protein BHM03_00018341 [Ensete ventricosum]|nr:hypothetical protein BHM03_00018341 [Ensete ventricosum]